MVAPNPPPRDYRRETADLLCRQMAREARRSCDGLHSAKDLSDLCNIGRKERLNAMAAGRLAPPVALSPCHLWPADGLFLCAAGHGDEAKADCCIFATPDGGGTDG